MQPNLNDATASHEVQEISKDIEIIICLSKGSMEVWKYGSVVQYISICFPVCSSKDHIHGDSVNYGQVKNPLGPPRVKSNFSKRYLTYRDFLQWLHPRVGKVSCYKKCEHFSCITG